MSSRNEKEIKGKVSALPEFERMFNGSGNKVSGDDFFSLSIDHKEYVFHKNQFLFTPKEIKIGDTVEALVVIQNQPHDRFQEATGHLNRITKLEANIGSDESQWNRKSILPLAEAIEAGIEKQKCFVYKLSVGGSDYIGFTSQKPETRLQQHLDSAKERSPLNVHKELRRFGYLHEFEVVSEHEDEVSALVAEIINIKKFQSELNTSIGGEGNNYNVVEKTDINTKEKIFFVENLKLHAQEPPKNYQIPSKMTHRHLINLIVKIESRYKSLEEPYEEKAVDWIHLNYPVGHTTINNRWGYLTRLLVFRYAMELKQRHHKLINWKYNDFEHIDHFNAFTEERGLKCYRKGLFCNTLDRRTAKTSTIIIDWKAKDLSATTGLSLEEAKSKIHLDDRLKSDENFDHELMLFYQKSFPDVERVFVSEDHLGLCDLAMKIAGREEYSGNIKNNDEFLKVLSSQDWLVKAIDDKVLTKRDIFYFPRLVFQGEPKKTEGFFGTKLLPTEKTVWEFQIKVDVLTKSIKSNSHKGKPTKKVPKHTTKEEAIYLEKKQEQEQKQSFATGYPNLKAEAEDLNQSLGHKNDTRTKVESPGAVRDFYIALAMTIGLFLFLGFTGILDIVDQWINS